ncbi:hypothetical protein, partial [Mycolicibacterium sp. NCC-Tsukiji]|uniref:hypothetical protein n=1 Tax=Mycolicibacterium sp. NCC-Tsukiji TaxID=2185272 RepID=UPI001AE10A36
TGSPHHAPRPQKTTLTTDPAASPGPINLDEKSGLIAARIYLHIEPRHTGASLPDIPHDGHELKQS